MKRILDPWDFFEPSIQAFKFTLEIAEKTKGQVLLLHIVEVPVMYDTMISPVLNFQVSLFNELNAKAEKTVCKNASKICKGEC